MALSLGEEGLERFFILSYFPQIDIAEVHKLGSSVVVLIIVWTFKHPVQVVDDIVNPQSVGDLVDHGVEVVAGDVGEDSVGEDEVRDVVDETPGCEPAKSEQKLLSHI